MSSDSRWRMMFALLAAFVLALGVAACGDDDDDDGDGGGEASGELIESNSDNQGVELTVGSKNFTEQFILGEIYAQGLEAAGYTINTDLNLGSEQVALQALEAGEISGYPEYTSTALTSFFGLAPEDVPNDPAEATEQSQAEFEKQGLVAFEPAPFNSANAVGLLAETAEELDVETVSDLEGKSQDLTLFGSPECRQRVDCLVGLQDGYGLEFAKFTPVDIEQRYPVLDDGQADLSILFTTDPQLQSDEYVILDDDQGVFPAGNPVFVASQDAVDQAGPDFQETIEKVQEGLSLEVMQELNARVDIDQQDPAQVATQYLQESGYVE
ncbi:MAG TPA: glycine betaine ABC transporter substrate-binding protein [Solirubrobacterales bacterium]|jgi:glycine betaine/choline ABC-type transport system substrate-binding protein|nr:glycine betaine ABC transporter substrate-binding protein [Solirubrobacterales bacterium]